MKYIGTILISGLLFSATTLPAQPKEQVMTLDEMYALADANSKTIKIFETALQEPSRTFLSHGMPICLM